jgi:ribosomal protein S27AE
MRKNDSDFGAPAPTARRLRRRNFLFLFLMMIVVLIISIIFGQFGLLDNQLFSRVYAVTGVCLFVGYGARTVMRTTVLCPRCGWNIFYAKPMPTLAVIIPSACPNCGLDLENLPPGPLPATVP